MKVYHSIEDFPSEINTIITIGTFDGVHQGHQKILDRVVSKARTEGLTSILLTFFPHPRMVLQPDHDLKLINKFTNKSSTSLIIDPVASLNPPRLRMAKFGKYSY